MIVSIAQLNPVWLNKKATYEKVEQAVIQASKDKSDLVCLGEAFLPGYPFWTELTDGAKFESEKQKEFHALYLQQAVTIERGDLAPLQLLALQKQISIYLGVVERPLDRGGNSLYCSLVFINKKGEIGSIHRKLMPTHEERLSWGIGDGQGLLVHELNEFHVGGLNCWENWMPLARTALYAQGETLHIATWPGNERNTTDLTRHIARENRMYALSVCGLMERESIPKEFPHKKEILTKSQGFLANGGSCLADPTGEWLIPPIVNEEAIVSAEIDLGLVYKERQNFDPSGHYSRPDIFDLKVNRQRQKIIKFED